MKIGEHDFTPEQITAALAEEGNKADYEALRGSELFKSEITQEGVLSYLDTDNGKKILQPFQDRAVTKGIQTHLEKNKDKYIDVDTYNSLKAEVDTKQNEFDTKLSQVKINSTLEKDLLANGLKPAYLDMVVGNIDKTGLTIRDGKLIGSNEIIAGAKEKYVDLFGDSKLPKIGGNAGNGNPPGGSETDKEKEAKNKMRVAAGLPPIK